MGQDGHRDRDTERDSDSDIRPERGERERESENLRNQAHEGTTATGLKITKFGTPVRIEYHA